KQPGLGEQLAAAAGLALALVSEADVHPAGEQVQFVPLALAVAEQDESARHATSLSSMPSALARVLPLGTTRQPGQPRHICGGARISRYDHLLRGGDGDALGAHDQVS